MSYIARRLLILTILYGSGICPPLVFYVMEGGARCVYLAVGAAY